MAGRVATALWKARMQGGLVAVDASERPADAAAAYAMQQEVADLFDDDVVGWKLGATNDKALEMLGFDRPFVGPLLAQHFHAMDEAVSVYPEHHPGLETEFLVAMASDLPPRDAPYSDDEVAAAVDYVCPAFEIVACRSEDGFTKARLLLIVDGAANLAVIQGQPVADWRSADLSDHPLRVMVNGEEAASGSSNLLMWGNPFGAVAYLANHPAVAWRGVRSGDRIMTGTCGGLLPIGAGDEARADFGLLGTVRTRLV